jgi:adenylate cyclase
LERRLCTVLAADVVGYSRLMRLDEAGTLERLKSLRQEVLQPKIAERKGRVVKLMGDGLLAEFSSVVEAVQCAIEIQKASADREPHLSEDRRLRLRIGLNLGDIIVEESDIYGDGVNVAARLETLAQPGGICVSGAVYDQIRNRIDVSFQDLGERQVKNIDQPLRVWCWPEASAKSKAEVNLGRDPIPLICVEAFSHGGDVDRSADLAEELRSEILDALAHRSGVRVALSAGGDEKPTYLLQGRCRVAGNRCRLHLFLTIAATGESFWSTKIDREIDDLSGFLDDVVARISTALRFHMNAYAGAVYASRPDSELTFQQLLSKAAFFFYRVDAKSVEISRGTMEAAVAKAPEHPMALAMHAYAIMQTVPLAMGRVADIDADAAVSFADRSVDHGSNVDFVFRNRARIRLWLRRDHEGCRADARRALSINPRYHAAKENLSLADVFGGHATRGATRLAALLREAETEPFHTPYRHSMFGIAYALAGDGRAAVDHAREGYEQRPFIPVHALAYAIAASEDGFLTGADEFHAMIDRHGLTVRDADRLPFASESDALAVADRLRRPGLPE